MKIDVKKLYGQDFFEVDTVSVELIDDRYKKFYKHDVAIIEFVNKLIESKEIIKSYFDEYKSLLTEGITGDDIDYIINRYNEMIDMDINVIKYIFCSVILMNELSKHKEEYIRELSTCKKKLVG